MALYIAVNAKTQRYGTCNTAESVLVASAIAAEFLPRLASAMHAHHVEMRVCERSKSIISQADSAVPLVDATDSDWYEEYLAPILAIKVVDGVEQAIEHINHYSSQHSETIVTDHYQRAMDFIRQVDSSSVMVNVSTRFADGFEYGLGAEIGISTDKIHARGPVGLEGLTSQKFVVLGSGQIRT